MLHHFRHLLPFLQSPTSTITGGSGTHTQRKSYKEDDAAPALTALHYYDAAIQLARTSAREPTQAQFERGIRAAEEIKRMCVPPFLASLL
jgi:hypothetical protein